MDPAATLERLRIACGEDDLAEITAAARDLLGWIRGGGFIPAVSEPQLSALLIMAQAYPTVRADELSRLGDDEIGL